MLLLRIKLFWVYTLAVFCNGSAVNHNIVLTFISFSCFKVPPKPKAYFHYDSFMPRDYVYEFLFHIVHVVPFQG